MNISCSNIYLENKIALILVTLYIFNDFLTAVFNSKYAARSTDELGVRAIHTTLYYPLELQGFLKKPLKIELEFWN